MGRGDIIFVVGRQTASSCLSVLVMFNKTYSQRVEFEFHIRAEKKGFYVVMNIQQCLSLSLSPLSLDTFHCLPLTLSRSLSL